MNDIKKIRNIGIIAHIDAGKTTTTERMLYYSGTVHKMGTVDEGTTVTDWMEDEQNRGITIVSAAITCSWKDHQINIVDTPGHVDFTAEVERSLRVLDGAIGVFCAVGGVEAQSETVWRQANKYKIPRIAFINKMDRVGANFDNVLQTMKKMLNANPVALTIPWGAENSFCGIVDILAQKAFTYDSELGDVVVEKEIPEDLKEKADSYYDEIIDKLADFDDSIIEKYSEGNLAIEDLKKSIRQATLQGKIVPVFCGAALRNKGIQSVLDAIIDYLPSPQDVPPAVGINPKNNQSIKCSFDDKTLSALAFKTTFDKHGSITYARIYSGVLNAGTQIYNSTRKKVERINRLAYIHGRSLQKCEKANAGDIVGIIGLKYTSTGDTICDKKNPVLLEEIAFPETVISKAIEPKVTADKDRLVEALEILSKDDPTFQHIVDEESGQILISGMGELHLDIIYSRIQKEHKIATSLGKPRVSYRETIKSKAQGEIRLQKQINGKDLFAYLLIQLEPHTGETIKIENHIAPGEIPKIYNAAIEEGLKAALTSGSLAGYPLINLKATILKGEAHPTNSSEMAFTRAAFEAVREAVAEAGEVLLEPIMRFQLQIPIANMGDIINDLNCRRAEILTMEQHGEIQCITGKVPLSEMFGYSNSVRGLTQGRGSYTMEPLEYAPVPKEIQDKIILY